MSVPPAAPLLSLLRLVSPSLPLGAYAGSEGLEWAVEAGWVDDEASTLRWIGGRLEGTLTHLDIPLLARFLGAWQRGDEAARRHWADFLNASRETRELAAQDRSLGRALARLLADLGVAGAAEIEACEHSHVALFALAAHAWGIGLEAAAQGYLFAWCEGQVAAAIKLVPLGQTQGQRVLGALLTEIPSCAAVGLALPDDEIGLSEPGTAIASARHETQYSRMFRC